MILKQIYPPTMMLDLEASSQEAILELAKAFPYRPAAEAAGLNRFQRVRHACHAWAMRKAIIYYPKANVCMNHIRKTLHFGISICCNVVNISKSLCGLPCMARFG